MAVLGRSDAYEAFRDVVEALRRDCGKSSLMSSRAVPWAPTVSAWLCRRDNGEHRGTRYQTHKGRMLGYFTLLAMASLIWSAQGTAVKFLDRHMGPIAITFVPFYITTLLFVPLLIRKRRANPQASRPTWSDWGKFTFAGVLGRCWPNWE